MQNVNKVAISSDSLIGHLPFRRHCLKDHDSVGQLTHTKFNQIVMLHSNSSIQRSLPLMTALNALLISSDDSNEVHMGERVPWQKEVWAYYNNI